jgi:hypothetical protein
VRVSGPLTATGTAFPLGDRSDDNRQITWHIDLYQYRQLRRPTSLALTKRQSRYFDDVSLNPFALWASKRSEVLAQRARLNRRQPHWRTASRALRTLVLCVEHGCSLRSGP